MIAVAYICFRLSYAFGLPLGVFKSNVLPGLLTDLSECLCGILHLKPTAGCQMSTSIREGGRAL